MIRIRRLSLLLAFFLTCLTYLALKHFRQPPPPPVSPFGDSTPVHWKPRSPRHRVSSYIPLPTGPAANIPKIQHDFKPESTRQRNDRLSRRDAVKATFVRSWDGYKKHAWGKDELMPISKEAKSSFGGWGATLVDALDTLWIMDLKDEFREAVKAVEAIDFGINDLDTLNVFETTIRYLGGLLAAHDLSNGEYPGLLQQASKLGEMLYAAFDTPHRMPVMRWQWRKSVRNEPINAGSMTLLAEFGSLSLEFTRLAQLTGEVKYFDAVQRVNNELDRMQNATAIPGLWPIAVDILSWPTKTPLSQFTFGGMADSMYEYLPKLYLLLGGRGQEGRQLQKMYQDAIDAAEKYLFFRPMTEKSVDVLLSGNARAMTHNVTLEPQGQHLACFTGGMVGMGAKLFNRPDDLDVAKRLVGGCVWAYDAMATHLMPELFYTIPCHKGISKLESGACNWNESAWFEAVLMRNHLERKEDPPTQEQLREFADARALPPGFTDIADRRYMLRPEAIESIFILYRLTGDSSYQELAWSMFSAIETATKTEIANSGVEDVTRLPVKQDDRMESFWLAETLKYFYLVFSEPELVGLDDWVLNTEAHPLKIMK